jgi:hypothetical protein
MPATLKVTVALKQGFPRGFHIHAPELSTPCSQGHQAVARTEDDVTADGRDQNLVRDGLALGLEKVRLVDHSILHCHSGASASVCVRNYLSMIFP